jgi:Flp pilus assembly protein TadG
MRWKTKTKGSVMLALALCLAGLAAVAAVGVDLGRMYITKGELQTFSDSAALAATLQLDGTTTGLSRARATALANTNEWNLSTTAISNATVAFGKEIDGAFEEAPSNAAGYRYVRVTAAVDLPLTFGMFFRQNGGGSPPLAFLTAAQTTSVRGTSGAGQIGLSALSEGLFPFSPLAHSTTGPHFGLIPGVQYTLRWASNPRRNQNVCSGDNVDAIITLAEAGGGSERGFIEDTSSSMIRAAIEGDQQTITRTIGEAVTMTGGAKQTMVDSIIARVRQDTDATSASYASYAAGAGNGRRIIAVPINTGYPLYQIVQIGAFLLLPPTEYTSGGNKPFCAEYVGSYVFGASHKGAAETGVYVARLIP